MREELDYIDFRLRFSTIIESVIIAVDKDFSLCANHPKGCGELFRECIDTYLPGELILHVERASWSCQDLAVKLSGAV